MLKAREVDIGLGGYAALEPLEPFGPVARRGVRADAEVEVGFSDATADVERLALDVAQRLAAAARDAEAGVLLARFIGQRADPSGRTRERRWLRFEVLFEHSEVRLDADGLITRIRANRTDPTDPDRPRFEVVGDVVRWAFVPHGAEEPAEFFAPPLSVRGPVEAVRVLTHLNPATAPIDRIVRLTVHRAGDVDQPVPAGVLGDLFDGDGPRVYKATVRAFLQALTSIPGEYPLPVKETGDPPLFRAYEFRARPERQVVRLRAELVGGAFGGESVVFVGVARRASG